MQIAERRSAQQSPQLRPEQLLPVEADADGPVAERRVRLFRQVQVRHLLVRADVERADNHGLFPHLLQNLFISLELLFFRRQGITAHVQKFAAEQPDSLRPVLQCALHVVRMGDVGIDTDADPRARNGGRMQQLQELFAVFPLLPLLFPVNGNGLPVRIYKDPPGGAVHNQGGAFPECVEPGAQAHHGGDAKRAGQNGGVRRPGPLARHEGQHGAFVHLDGFARRQVVRGDNARLRGRKIGFFFLPLKNPNQPA